MSTGIKQSLLLAVFAVSACRVGPQIDNLDLAHNPQGATIEVEISQGDGERPVTFLGELLTIDDNGVYFIGSENGTDRTRVSFVAWPRASRLKATEFGGYRASIGRSLEWNEESRDRFQLLGRFPQGISADVMARLLAAHNQDSVDQIL